jgi:two-component system NtrC family sensor kinase
MLEVKGSQLEEAYAELKATQIRILQQEKMATIGQLAAGVAHEINNPIGFITSNLRTLEKYLGKLGEFIKVQADALRASGDQAALEAVARARKEHKLDYIAEDIGDLVEESLEGAERVRKIVQDLKTFSRVNEAEWQFVNLVEGLESTITIVWNEIKYKATLVRDFAELPPVRCYSHQLNQVFMNLLVNAAQAIDKEGRITVKAWQEGEAVAFSVADTGCGIPPENLNQIFMPFFTTKEAGKGTGLGLSVSYEIVQKHQGEILVDSELGKGTTFTVRIPIDARGQAGQPEA